MLYYDMPLWRPPSEAESQIFQVTLGCSFNRCSFCSMYRSKAFSVRPLAEVEREIHYIARMNPSVRRVFLADGDALACPTEHLVALLTLLKEAFVSLQRITSYALPSNLLRKSVDELRSLREHGLQMIYYGIESGSPEILKRITKGATPRSMVEGLGKAREAGLKVSATVILGLGGRTRWEEHVDGTVALVNQLHLDYLSTLQLQLEPVVREEFFTKFARLGGAFEPQDDYGMLAEQARLVAHVDPPTAVVFRSNHASNALPLRGILPRDREPLLAMLGAARDGQLALRPQWLRGY